MKRKKKVPVLHVRARDYYLKHEPFDMIEWEEPSVVVEELVCVKREQTAGILVEEFRTEPR